MRYAAYATRVRTIMISASRYVAYTSDVGESFRPVAHPYIVRGAYGISWAYLVGDVSHEGWKAFKRNQKLLHPEDDQHFHSLVKYSGKALKNAANPVIRTWGPIGVSHFPLVIPFMLTKLQLGLAVVPALPFMFDKPVEEAVEWTFYQGFRAVGGERAVGERHSTGRSKELQHEVQALKGVKEKEL